MNVIIIILLSTYFVMLQVWQSMFKNPILCVLDMEIRNQIASLLPYKMIGLEGGFNYLGLFLKPNGYNKGDFMGDSIKAKTDGRTRDKKFKLVQLGFMCKEFMENLI